MDYVYKKRKMETQRILDIVLSKLRSEGEILEYNIVNNENELQHVVQLIPNNPPEYIDISFKVVNDFETIK